MSSSLVREMEIGDLDSALALLSSDRRVAFLGWEEAVLRKSLSGKVETGLRSLVIEENDQIGGVVLFGVGEGYSSINHIIVSEDRRKDGVSARTLLNEALVQCNGRVHLMVVAGNTEANRFFESQGFTSGGSFMEIDFPSDDPLPDSSDFLNDDAFGRVHNRSAPLGELY